MYPCLQAAYVLSSVLLASDSVIGEQTTATRGFLYIFDQSVKTWRQRWFVVDQDRFSIFKDQTQVRGDLFSSSRCSLADCILRRRGLLMTPLGLPISCNHMRWKWEGKTASRSVDLLYSPRSSAYGTVCAQITSPARVVYLAADTQEDMQRWMRAIQKAITLR